MRFDYAVTSFLSFNAFETSWSPVQGALPTVPDQETEETQPHAPKVGASSQVWEQRGREKCIWM
jgi:hypothetical protein